MAGITRADWQKLAEDHLVAAQALIAAGCWADAYYLAGYAVECGLKACILVRLAAEPEVIFDAKRFSEKCWSHDLAELIGHAGLQAALDADCTTNLVFRDNWNAVKGWKETARYDPNGSQATAEALVLAIADAANGVMPWIRSRW